MDCEIDSDSIHISGYENLLFSNFLSKFALIEVQVRQIFS